MRIQLHADKPQLEKLLDAVETLLTQRPSERVTHAARRAHHELARFGYVRDIRPILREERELQERYGFALDNIERTISGYAHGANETNSTEGRAASKSTETHAEKITAARKTIEACTKKATELIREPTVISDGSLLTRCLDLAQTVETTLGYAKAFPAIREDAQRLAYRVENEIGRLHENLLNHLQFALTRYPRALAERGVTERRARSLTQTYAERCTTVERDINRILHACTTILELPQGRADTGSSGSPSSPSNTDAGDIMARPPALLIGTSSQSKCDALEKALRTYGDITRFKHIPYLAIRTEEKIARDLFESKGGMRAFDADSTISHERIFRIRTELARYLAEDWNLELIEAPKAWTYTRGKGATVAIIDTGADYRHPDIAERFGTEKGYNVVDDNNDPYDQNGHGTHVAGTIAGRTTGVAPETTLYAVRVLNAEGIGSEIEVIRGIEWAIDKQVKVMNMSLGSPYGSNAEAAVIAVAKKQGISVACAAGNDGNDSYNYPASHEGAISVAAIDRNKKHAVFSNYNDRVDIAAPGVAIYSTWPGGGYETLSGTSMATPHMAGACALVSAMKTGEPESVLKKSAEKLGEAKYFGAGLIRLEEALKHA